MTERINKLRSVLKDGECAYITSFANVFYYSGFCSEDASLVINHDKAYIITDSRYTIQAGEQAPDFELFDIKNGVANLWKKIDSRKIYIEEENLTVRGLARFKASAGAKELGYGSELISGFRKIKDTEEIKKIAEAERLGDEAFEYILTRIRPGRTEAEIALELEYFMRSKGASGLSFDTIAASGIRSAMPHGAASGKIIENGDLLTLDFGCVLDGYCSDMTRTVAVGSVTDEQRYIYDTVLNAQKLALAELKPGKICADVDKAARDYIASRGYGGNFGHGLGHSVGIEIHEQPVLSPKCSEEVKSGHVLTVEPGVYVEGLGGVRIEDLTAVTEDGIKNLTRSPKELIIID